MFDSIRNNSKILMGLLFLLVIPSFVLFGIEGYSQLEDKGAVVAKVDGQTIKQTEWDAAHQAEVQQFRTVMPNLDPKLLDSPQARYGTLEKMVNDRLIARAAEKQGLVTSDQRLVAYLLQDPAIVNLRGADGKLDLERYHQLAASQGMTPEMLEARVRLDLSRQQVLTGLQASAFASQGQTDAALDAYLQRREIQFKRWAPAHYAAKLNASQAELELYYKENTERFRSVENVDLEYLVLDVAALESRIELTEQDIQTYYEQNVQRLGSQEQRRASHILINAGKDMSAADKQKARTKAENLLASVRKSPQAFAEVARKNSDDSGSAERGGDLDFFARGAMVKPFEDAAFALQKGGISDVVESDFGYHIIMLTDVKRPQTPTLESMRAQLVADLRKQRAQRQFAELAETFSNGVHEQSDSLTPVAERLKLQVQKTQGLSRTPTPAAPAHLTNPKLLQAIFSDDTINKSRNTAAVEVASNTLVSARVIKHRPSVIRTLEEVKAEVLQQWTQAKSAELAKAEGQTQLARWKTDAEQAVLGETVTVSRDQVSGLPQEVVDAALRADPTKTPTFLGVDLGIQGYAVVRVNKIVPRAEAADRHPENIRQQFSRLRGQVELQAYLAGLKSKFKAEILVEKPPKTSAGSAVAP